ncbi:MAG: hypothetical protein K9N62_19990 [Verrucomicrobia bacterium]|nr:hypothetical protein [Verrucomicrobiota bacterium]
MNDTIQDDLWPHFETLWPDLQDVSPGILLAGGYGLFLKQQWLLSQHRSYRSGFSDSISEPGTKIFGVEPRTVIEIDRWADHTPRSTKDFDFIAGLDLIASPTEQRRLDELLKKHDFKVVPENARWQFAKAIDKDRSVVLDFHTPPPIQARSDVRVQSRRVKPQPSLGQSGIHGRENAETDGSELHPFSFKFRNLEIVLPNPVTLVLMKTVAMRDRWQASQNTTKNAAFRDLEHKPSVACFPRHPSVDRARASGG